MSDNELLASISGILDKKLESINDCVIGMEEKITSIKGTVTAIGGQVASMGERVGSVGGQVASIGERVGSVGGQVASIGERVGSVGGQVASMGERVASMGDGVASIGKRVTSIEMTLENETNKNIKVIAEGHLDLSRKLNEAVRIASDIKSKQEIQDIYINMHENRLRDIL